MSEQITPEIFNHLVTLAALELTDQEAEYLRKQLNNQLKAIHELEAVPVAADVPVAAHGVPYTPENAQPIREDVWIPYPDTEDILAQAPSMEERYFVVPDIPHQKLD
jgi:aspartyl/glutamyl-tRNA(Asn/Gln) amidotransferase C subunit